MGRRQRRETGFEVVEWIHLALGSMKGGGFFGKLSEYHLLKKGSAP